MHNLSKFVASFLTLTLLLISLAQLTVNAQDDFILREEERWDTYGCGGTCIPGTHDLAIADVDGDGTKEIMTGGYAYLLSNNTRTSLYAPLRIMSWDGQSLSVEKQENWTGNIWVVYAADADGDLRTEILTAGTVVEGNMSAPALRFWNWNGNSLVLRGTFFNISIASIFAGDLNKDGKTEIATVGRPLNTSEAIAQLSIWNWDGNNLESLKSVTWGEGENSRANSVYAQDLNNDGLSEILTAGYNNGLKNSSGQIRVWQWNGTDLKLVSNAEWRLIENTYALDVAGNPMGNTMANNVKIADVDDDGFPEVITGGFTYDGVKVNGQLRIWNWTDSTLNLEKSQEWTTYDITELKSITINDVDKDGKTEIVTSGVTAGRGAFAQNATLKELAQLRVWTWNGATLTLGHSKDWIVDEGVSAWQDETADLNNDGNIEIVTVGCSYLQTMCDPNLRIWSLPNAIVVESSPIIYIVAAGIVGTVTAVGLIFLVKARKKKNLMPSKT